MPVADSSADVTAWVERYGSFGLIAAMILWGGPRVLAELKAARDSFLLALEKRDARDVIEHDQTVRTLTALTAEIKELSEKTDQYGKMIDQCSHRHPLPVKAG